MLRFFVVVVLLAICCGQLHAESITVGGSVPSALVQPLNPSESTRGARAASLEPIEILVERGSVNDNLERIVHQLGWSGYMPHFSGSLVIRKTFTLELLPSRIPVSPQYMSDVIHSVLASAVGVRVKPFLHIPDQVVVLVNEESAQ